MELRFLWPALVILTGCSVGPKVDQFAPAREPAGVEMRLRFRSGRQVPLVELLAVQDTALVIREDTVIQLVPFAALRWAKTLARGSNGSFSGGPDQSVRTRLRLLSRYPGGLTPALLEQLLAAYGQADLLVVRS